MNPRDVRFAVWYELNGKRISPVHEDIEAHRVKEIVPPHAANNAAMACRMLAGNMVTARAVTICRKDIGRGKVYQWQIMRTK